MELFQDKLEALSLQISALDELIKRGRKEQDWDFVNQTIDEVQLLEKEHDELQRFAAHQKSLQEIEDFWDDDKNRDTYTMLIIEKEFSDVAS